MKEFKYIKGYEGLYQINIDGVVRRVHKDHRSQPYKILKISIRNGYYFYTLSGKKYNLHRLLMINYTNNPDNLPCVNHIDGNRLNNDISNLEWCTYKHNTRHAYKIGNMIPKDRAITDKQIKDIINMRATGTKPGVISKMYGVSYTTIYRVCKGIRAYK
jgi:hypothetical protein